MIIGITGGTGCGKTTLLDLIRDRGGLVLDCDAIYHDLLHTDASLLHAIENRFPGTVENRQLQRKKLGSIVFADSAALEDLNRITHSAITAEVLRQLKSQPKLAAIDAIALFESGLHKFCDVTVAITAPTEDRVSRLMARDGISENYARSRIAAQPSNEDFSARCDYTLENSGEFHVFQSNCLAFLREIGIMEL
jgi:dephospho-CoA kinase